MNAGKRLLKTLKSVKLAVSLLIVIAIVLIVATVIKNQSHARRYIYHSWWFISLLGLFCLNLLLCSAGRWSFKTRRLGTTVTHAGVLVMVVGVVVSAVLGERGSMLLHIGESGETCYAETNEKYKWDGAAYPTEEDARTKKAEHESNDLEVQLVEHGGGYLLYARSAEKSALAFVVQLRDFEEAIKKKADYESNNVQVELVEYTHYFLFTRPAEKLALPFVVHLDDFKVEPYPGHVPGHRLMAQVVDQGLLQAFPIERGKKFAVTGTPYSVTTLRYEPDFVILDRGIYGSRSSQPNNPAIQVRVSDGAKEHTQWVFAKRPGLHQAPDSNLRLFYLQMGTKGRVKAYKSWVRLSEDGKVVASKTIEVNKPLKYKGYCIYQSNYDHRHELYSIFEIAKDPGVNLVYAGFLLISAGVLFTFYVRPLLLRPSVQEHKAP